MIVTPIGFPGAFLLEPDVHLDARGHFFESFNAKDLAEAIGRDIAFVQDNQARSMKGVLRGLHYQLPPAAQAKLIRVVAGEVFDVAVDLRHGSPRYGHWFAVTLSAESRYQLFLPEGFAHGYLAMSEGAEVLYKASAHYDPALERAIRWDDPDIDIDWPAGISPILSGKDAAAALFRDAETFP